MRGWRIGTISGIVIEINYTWLIIFGLFLVSLSTSWFPRQHPELPRVYHWIAGFGATLLLFLSVLIHELSHSLVARRSGIDVSRITLFVFGGVAQMKSEPTKAVSELKMAIAGPATSVLLAAFFAALWQLTRPVGPGLISDAFGYLALLNGVLAVFNLVPAFPLDGGRVLRSIIWHYTRNLEYSTRIAASFGQGFGFLLMAVGFWFLFQGNPISGLWYLALGWLLAGAAQASYQRLQMQNALGDVPVSNLMSSPAVTMPAEISIEEAVQNYFLALRHGAFPVVDSDGTPIGILSLSRVKELPREQWPTTQARDAMEPLDWEKMTIDMHAEAVAAMLKMAENGRGRLLVTNSHGRLIGVISQSDIGRLIRIKSGLAA